MEVTRDNFKKACEILERELTNADFVAIDGEFTGLSTIKQKRPGYDTLEEMYIKTRVGTGRMLLIQYGISLFTWNEECNHYEAMPFTFYIFPRPYKKYGNDVIFTGQSSSVDFLTHNGFDFNKLFRKGISFMIPSAEEKARQRIENELSFLEEKRSGDGTKPPGIDSPEREMNVFIPEDQREFIDNICDSVDNFMNNEDELCIDLPPCSMCQRELVYEVIGEKYPLGLYLECITNEGDEKHIRGHKTSRGLKNVHEEKRKEEEKILEDAIGFSKVIRLLSQSKKPIIGHNMLLDLFLTITNFFGPPPFSLRDFKQSISNIFPVVFDTKLIASTPPLNQVLYNTGLQSIIKSIEDETLPIPDIMISEVLKDEAESANQYHQAGYDAYCTGRIFLSLSNYVFTYLDRPPASERIDLSCNIMERYTNRVYIMGIRDIIFTDLSKEDSIPDRRNIFYIQYPISWKQKDIENLFSPYSSISYPVNWINHESALVTIYDEGSLDNILVNLVMKPDNAQGYYVLPYSDYINNRDPRIPETNTDVPRKRKRIDNEVED